jgi:hypothetical protein
MKYTIHDDGFGCFEEGGCAEFYWIKEDKTLGFKQFGSKKSAKIAYDKQKLLSKFDLAPKVVGKITKLKYQWGDDTDWGYVTERAKILDEKVMKKRLKDIQNLVETIENKTRLRFWDCHYWNVGYVKRNNKAKLVCIDTGAESFSSIANAWGFGKPGPKCDYCSRYQCRCNDSYWCD